MQSIIEGQITQTIVNKHLYKQADNPNQSKRNLIQEIVRYNNDWSLEVTRTRLDSLLHWIPTKVGREIGHKNIIIEDS